MPDNTPGGRMRTIKGGRRKGNDNTNVYNGRMIVVENGLRNGLVISANPARRKSKRTGGMVNGRIMLVDAGLRMGLVIDTNPARRKSER